MRWYPGPSSTSLEAGDSSLEGSENRCEDEATERLRDDACERAAAE